jgi:ornithine cyclodeaminase
VTLSAAAPRWIAAEELRRALPMNEAIDALEAALRAPGLPDAPQRVVASAEGGQLLVMPAAGAIGSGAKLVTVQPDNPSRGLPLVQAAYALFARETLVPLALFEGAELTRLRTAAVSAVATRHLAREDATQLLVFGAGVQARGHVEAMVAVRPIEQVIVVDSGSGSAGELVTELTGSGIEGRVGRPEDVRETDIVCACTTASEPLFDGQLLAAGTHVNAVGSYQPHTREVDSRTLARAQVVLEDRNAVLAEAGDLRIPLDEGAIDSEWVAGDLRDVVTGACRRSGPDAITFFKSVGVAWEDLVVTAAAAAALGLAE